MGGRSEEPFKQIKVKQYQTQTSDSQRRAPTSVNLNQKFQTLNKNQLHEKSEINSSVLSAANLSKAQYLTQSRGPEISSTKYSTSQANTGTRQNRTLIQQHSKDYIQKNKTKV